MPSSQALPDLDATERLRQAVIVNALELAQEALAAGGDVHARAREKPLTQIPLEDGRSKMLALLLGAGAPIPTQVEVSPSHWQTPLHKAIGSYRGHQVDVLLQFGADPNARCSRGTTALHLAAIAFSKLIPDLLKAGADPNAQTPEGKTPLFLAASIGAFDTIAELLRFGADPLLADHEGALPIDALMKVPNRLPSQQLEHCLELLRPSAHLAKLQESVPALLPRPRRI